MTDPAEALANEILESREYKLGACTQRQLLALIRKHYPPVGCTCSSEGIGLRITPMTAVEWIDLLDYSHEEHWDRIALALKRGEEAMELLQDIFKYMPEMLQDTPNWHKSPSFYDRAAALLKEAE